MKSAAAVFRCVAGAALTVLVAACVERRASEPIASAGGQAADAASAGSIDTASAFPSDRDAGAPGAPGASCAVVNAPPRRVGDLEAALRVRFDDALRAPGRGAVLAPRSLQPDGGAGALSEDVVRVFATYDWDMHHIAPIASADAVRAKALTAYTVHFARGRTDCEAALRSSYGDGVAKEKPRRAGAGADAGSEPVQAYGPFFLGGAGASGDGPFTLEWHAKTPDWAAASVSEPARLKTLTELASRMQTASAAEAPRLAAFASGVSGIVARAEGGAVQLELVPPMKATDVARALGLRGAIAESTDVHMSSYRLAIPAGAGAWSAPRSGRWETGAALDGAARGPSISGARPGPVARRQLAASDVVRHIQFSPSPSP